MLRAQELAGEVDASVRSQSASAMASHGAVGPAMPALLTSTSRPPSLATTSSNSRATAAGSDTSQRVVRSAAAQGGEPRLVHVAHVHARALAQERVDRGEADPGCAGRDQNAQV